jgi:hypothetical protein
MNSPKDSGYKSLAVKARSAIAAFALVPWELVYSDAYLVLFEPTLW